MFLNEKEEQSEEDSKRRKTEKETKKRKWEEMEGVTQ